MLLASATGMLVNKEVISKLAIMKFELRMDEISWANEKESLILNSLPVNGFSSETRYLDRL
jgi:hypothetical protein